MKSIIVDERISTGLESSLANRGFRIIKLPASRELPAAICSHPDSLMLRIKNRLFTYSSYAESGLEVFSDIREYHRDIAIFFVSDEPGDVYPKDAGLNALVSGDRLFAKTDSLCEAVKEYSRSIGQRLIFTKQGYPACTTLLFGGKYAVTSDKGMKRVLEGEGIEVLLIRNGDISLSPYEYGFIGGASFVYEDKIFFYGDLSSHRDGEKIMSFARERGFSAVSLSGERLVDLGGAVILDQ